MESTIRIEFDFDKQEPYLQIKLPNDTKVSDMRDKMLMNFIENVSRTGGCYISYKKELGNSNPQIRATNMVEVSAK